MRATSIRSELLKRYLSVPIPNAATPSDATHLHIEPFLPVTKRIISELLENDKEIGNSVSKSERSIFAELLFAVVSGKDHCRIVIPDEFRDDFLSKKLCIALRPEVASLDDILKRKLFNTTVEGNTCHLRAIWAKLRDLISLILIAGGGFMSADMFTNSIAGALVFAIGFLILIMSHSIIAGRPLKNRLDVIPGMQLFSMCREGDENDALRRNLLSFHEKYSSAPEIIVREDAGLEIPLIAHSGY